AEILALHEDGSPAQPGLKALEAELLEQPLIVDDRIAPLLVVILHVLRSRRAPAAPRLAVRAHESSHRITSPANARRDRNPRRTFRHRSGTAPRGSCPACRARIARAVRTGPHRRSRTRRRPTACAASATACRASAARAQSCPHPA